MSHKDDNIWSIDSLQKALSHDDAPGLIIETFEDAKPLDAQMGVWPPKTVPDALYGPLFGQPKPTKVEIKAAGGDAKQVPPLNTFAILDAAKIFGLNEYLETSGLEHRCLFKGAAYDELKDVAPWIVRLEENNEFTRNLFTIGKAPWCMWEKEPGIYVRSRGTLEDMWRHFRKFTKVQDEKGKWFYFRFWDVCPLYDYLKNNAYGEKKIQKWMVIDSGFPIHFYAIGPRICYKISPVAVDRGHTKRDRGVILSENDKAYLYDGALRSIAITMVANIQKTSPDFVSSRKKSNLVDETIEKMKRYKAYRISRGPVVEKFVREELILGTKLEEIGPRGKIAQILKSDLRDTKKYTLCREIIHQAFSAPVKG